MVIFRSKFRSTVRTIIWCKQTGSLPPSFRRISSSKAGVKNNHDATCYFTLFSIIVHLYLGEVLEGATRFHDQLVYRPVFQVSLVEAKYFLNSKVVQLINILWGTCKTRAQPFSDMWRKPFLNNLFERVNLDHQLQLHQRNFILHKSKLNYISQINFGENNGGPVQLQDCREILRVLVKEVLRWISRHKLVAELKYSLIIDHFY